MPITIDSRGVSVYITDDEARAQATELAARAEQALDIADQRGWSLNASDAQRVQHDLDEAARLLTDIGEMKTTNLVDLSRFTQPGWAEQELAERDVRRAAYADQIRRMAETALMVDELGDDERSNERPTLASRDQDAGIPGSNDPPPVPENFPERKERVNLKRSFDSHGLEWWTLSGRGETKRFADYATAEREARRRAVGRA